MVASQCVSNPQEIVRQLSQYEARFAAIKAKGLKLDMTRGKPASEQLELSGAVNLALSADDYELGDGTDARNYGGLDGIAEIKAIFAEMLETSPANLLVGGNSSLTLMHDFVVRALWHGVPDGAGPWSKGKVKFLCPSPGYDRHFAICQHHGIQMIPVDLGAEGPKLQVVETLVKEDEAIKGMWCVPKYSNPTGITYSAEVVERLASMPTAAPDFRLLWDNAYAVHDLEDAPEPLPEIIAACTKAGYPNRPVVFASTSKISFAGAGVAALASSPANLADQKKHLAIQTIGPDKLNQLRHVRFFKNFDGLRAHMRKHQALLKPKFAAVSRVLEKELGGSGLATWSTPRGGYFVSLDTLDGCAAEVVRLAQEAGVKLTPAGATFPYGHDPRNRNIRIAPSFPPTSQVEAAMEVVAASVLLAGARQLAG